MAVIVALVKQHCCYFATNFQSSWWLCSGWLSETMSSSPMLRHLDHSHEIALSYDSYLCLSTVLMQQHCQLLLIGCYPHWHSWTFAVNLGFSFDFPLSVAVLGLLSSSRQLQALSSCFQPLQSCVPYLQLQSGHQTMGRSTLPEVDHRLAILHWRDDSFDSWQSRRLQSRNSKSRHFPALSSLHTWSLESARDQLSYRWCESCRHPVHLGATSWSFSHCHRHVRYLSGLPFLLRFNYVFMKNY